LGQAVRYRGVDRNAIFVEDARKRGWEIICGDAFEPELWQSSDVVLVIDILHHLSDEMMLELMTLAFSHALSKVVVVEPAFVEVARRWGIIGRWIGRLFSAIDFDGFNRIERWQTREEYGALFQRLGRLAEASTFQMKACELGGHHLVVYRRAGE